MLGFAEALGISVIMNWIMKVIVNSIFKKYHILGWEFIWGDYLWC